MCSLHQYGRQKATIIYQGKSLTQKLESPYASPDQDDLAITADKVITTITLKTNIC